MRAVMLTLCLAALPALAAEGGTGDEDWYCVADPIEGGWDCGRGAPPPAPPVPDPSTAQAPGPPAGVRPREDYTPEIRPLEGTDDSAPSTTPGPDTLFGAQPLESSEPAENPSPVRGEPVRATPDPAPATETVLPPTTGTVPVSPQGDYVIQLMGGHEPESVDAFIEKHGLQGQITRMRTERNGEPWYVVVMGPYADFAAARDALFALSPDLQELNPWIRRLSEMR